MGYGGDEKFILKPVLAQQIFPSGSPVLNIYNREFRYKAWSRSGSNHNPPRQKDPKFLFKYKQVEGLLRTKSKARKFNWHTKRYEYYWVYDKVYRMKKVKVKSPNPRRYYKLASPNDLNYQCSNLINTSSGSLSANYVDYDPRFVRIIDGMVGQYGAPWGSFSAHLPGNYAYDSGSLLVRYAEAISDLENQTLSRLYEKVKGQSVNLGAAFAESRQTIEMIGGMMRRIASSLVLIKRGKLEAAGRKLFPTDRKSVANDWLALQYGIKPLMQDIDGAVKFLAEKNADYKVVRFHVMQTKTVESVQEIQDRSVVYMDGRIIKEAKVSVHWTVNVSISSDFLNDLGKLGLVNLASVAWEVVPYSFIVDWALPIGDYLNNFDAFSGLTVETSCKTIYVKEKVKFVGIVGGKTGGWQWHGGYVGWEKENVKCVRQKINSIPAIPRPVFKDPISKGHMLNALALLAQLK